ncbi:hypothetical protein DRW03_28755 [Corallococcus sp. H22C18031201]|uniref:type VI secretion system protein IglI family protein n=1 Tax=Citreicoccus inhibens TaxID=2849499 RepID=UPI000E7403C9|nr:type VI secretion system protein IglI family protein [Citreicoccus inhibens]MBU8899462.1 hypothetical protein [Citreicoccus inhibens]RJS17057.1 hypothetical protein DRW03_28755 [Corallococcus sp. H22C18031201]
MGDAAAVLEVLDITLLDRPITGAPVDLSTEEGADPRLEAITTWVAKGAYLDAARSAEALLRQDLRDVRLVCPYLFGGFVARGMHALPVLFRSLSLTLTENWEAFGPTAKKALFMDNGLRWMFRLMSKLMEHHARLKDAQWQAWTSGDNRPPLQEALGLAEPVMSAFGAMPRSGAMESFRTLLNGLRAHLQALPEPVSVVPPVEEDEEEEEAEAPSASEAKGATARAEPKAPSGPVLPISPPLAQLIRKLSAFEALIASQDFVKASVVAVDVLAVIERFDPRVYLPLLFSGFFTGLSQNADSIEPLLHNTESLAFRALDQLYRVDLDAFLVAQARQGGGGGFGDED